MPSGSAFLKSGLPSYVLVLTLEYERESDAHLMLSFEQHLAALRERWGLRFMAYTNYHGPRQTTYILMPLLTPDEIKQGFEPLPQKRSVETLQTFDGGLKSAKGFIATYLPELSSPPEDRQLEAALYVNLISATMKPGLASDVKRAAWEAGQKIAAAHRQSSGGRKFLTYRSYSGFDEVVHIAVPFRGVEEPDAWMNNHELLQEVYGTDEATSLMQDIERAVKGSTSSIGKQHPSNP